MFRSAIRCILPIGILVFTFHVLRAQVSTFTNSTGQAHNTWDSGNNWGTSFTRTVNVTGLPASLSAAGTVLRQINIRLGNGVNTGLNMSTYAIRITSPAGTVIQVCNAGEFSPISIGDVNIKYRDHATLGRVSDIGATPSSAWPYHIGYYRVSTAGSFASVNGENPNGNWTFQVIENTATEIAFAGIDLVFGPAFTYTDITASTANDFCTGAQCLDMQNIILATNNGYQDPGPATDPALTVSGCSWNGARNNSAWFYFIASATTAKVTFSGFSNIQQTLCVSMSGTCAAPTYTVPTGGCPGAAINDNYQGGATYGISGMRFNQQLNLSGLTIGNTYYVIVDGNGGVISNFYIELESGAQPCAGPFSITDLGLRSNCSSNGTTLEWTAPVAGISYPEISTDGNTWLRPDVDVHSTASGISCTIPYDVARHTRFARVSVLDPSGLSRTPVVQSSCDDAGQILAYPNPANDFLTIQLDLGQPSVASIRLYRIDGTIAAELPTIQIDPGQKTADIPLSSVPSGTYFLIVDAGDGMLVREPVQILH